MLKFNNTREAMTFLSGTAFAADFFRVSYQSAEAVFNGPVAPQPSVAERIGRIIQIQIAVFDAFFTIGHYTGAINGLERFKDVIVPLRLAAIIQGVYQLINDPNVDRGSIHRSIFFNALNVGCSALRVLKQGTANPSVHAYLDYASFACTLADALYRIGLTYSQRTEIANKLSAIYQGAKNGVTNAASTIDHYVGYPLRILVTATIALDLFGNGLISLQKATQADSSIIYASLTVVGLGYGLVNLTQKTVRRIFDDIGIPHNKIRQITEWSFSIILGGTLTAAAAKGTGLVQSFSAMFKTAYPTVLMLAIVSSLSAIYIIGMDELKKELGFQPLAGEEVIWDSLEIGLGYFLLIASSESIAIGLGAASTNVEAAKLLFSSLSILISLICIVRATTTAGNALFTGVPTWDELFDLFKFYVTTSFLLWGFSSDHFNPVDNP